MIVSPDVRYWIHIKIIGLSLQTYDEPKSVISAFCMMVTVQQFNEDDGKEMINSALNYLLLTTMLLAT